MPGVTLHFVLADTVLGRWRSGDGTPPFNLQDPVAINAFYHGAVGPDLGYFPGGHRVLSDLAHCVLTGRLAQTLIRSARTVRERAFSLGWLTHFLADMAIHPVIGRGVGELLAGDRDRFVDGSSNPMAHLRVEMGVDAWHAQRFPEVRRRRLRPAFDADSIKFLVRAYAATYQVAVDPGLFLHSHRSTTRRVGQALGTMGLVVALTGGPGMPVLPVVRGALRAAYRRSCLRSLPLAYLNPVAPPPWMVEEVDREVSRHADDFMVHYRNGAAGLQDVNLDTGRPLALEQDHPGTRKALEGLALLASGAGAPVPEGMSASGVHTVVPVIGAARLPLEA